MDFSDDSGSQRAKKPANYGKLGGPLSTSQRQMFNELRNTGSQKGVKMSALKYKAQTGMEPPRGRFKTPSGTTLSARLNPDLLEMSLNDISAEDNETLTALTKTKGGRRGQRGGGPRWEAVKSFAMSAAGGMKEYTMSRVGAPLITEVVGFGKVSVNAADRLLIAFMSVFTLLGGVIQFTVGTTGRVASNATTAAQSAAAFLKRPESQQATADAVTAAANIPLSIAVAVAALTQGGLMSLTTVVAIILRSMGVALTGPARAAATLGFYLWYVRQPVPAQNEIKAKAAAYATAAAAGVEQARVAAAPLAAAIVAGARAAGEAVQRDPAAGAAVDEPADAALVAAAAEVAAPGQLNPAVGEAAVLLAGVAVAAVAGDANGEAAINALPNGGDAAVAGVQNAADAVVAVVQDAVAPEGAAPAPRRRRAAPVGQDAPAGGRRKTKKVKKSKRRMTRRARPTTLKFAY